MRVNPFRDRAALSPWLPTQDRAAPACAVPQDTQRDDPSFAFCLSREPLPAGTPQPGTGCPHLQAVDEEVSSQTTLLAVGQELHQAFHMALL